MATLIFDLDGTLVDSAPDLAAAVNHVLAGDGLGPISNDRVRDMIGQGATRLVERAYRVHGVETMDFEQLEARVQQFLTFYRCHPVVRTTVFPDVLEVLTVLHDAGHRIAICTNKPLDLAVQVCDHLGLTHLVDGLVGGQRGRPKKPDAAPLFAAISEVDGSLSDAIMVGDSPADVGGARAAGIPIVAVSFGYAQGAPESLGADVLIERLGQLPPLIPKLLRSVA